MASRFTTTTINGHTVLSSHLPRGGLLVDLGANRGAFSRLAQEKLGLEPAVLVEANPTLASGLADRSGWRVENAAISAANGTTTLHLAANDEGSSTLPLPEVSARGCTAVGHVEVKSVSLSELLRSLPPSGPDLLKMDIEGSETEVLLLTPQSDLLLCRQIAVEFHCDPAFGFGGRAEVNRAISRMKSMGFVCLIFNGDLTNVLFVNPRRTGISGLDLLKLRLLAPSWPILARAWVRLPTWFRRAIRRALHPRDS